jgi:CheY-like chemotaxis protein
VTISVAAFDDKTERERALRAGFNLFLSKPVDAFMLACEIARRVGSQ